MVDRDALAAHLADRYGLAAPAPSELDEGVWRVDRQDGAPWVARAFGPERPAATVAQDAAILHRLADGGFPAERLAAAEPISTLGDHHVLVTEFVTAGPAMRPGRPSALLGGMLGRLHTRSADDLGPGGAWHHLASGTPADEIVAAEALLESMTGSVGVRDLARLDRLREAVAASDGCADLPHAFVHPDFVIANAVPTPDQRLTIVDWTGAGRGPRLWSLGFLLWATGARSPRLRELAATRYARHIALEPEELARLGAAIRGRPLMLECWAVGHGRRGLAEAVARVQADAALAESIAVAARPELRGGDPGR